MTTPNTASGEQPQQPPISSLEAIEAWYDLPLGDELLHRVRTTPYDQLMPLKQHIEATTGGWARPVFGPGQRPYLNEQALLSAGITTDIANTPGLKHSLLYGGTCLVRDPLTRAFLPEQIADGLRQLMPLADLIRDGKVVLVKSADPVRNLHKGNFSSSPLSIALIDLDSPIKGADPYANWLYRNQPLHGFKAWLQYWRRSEKRGFKEIYRQYPDKQATPTQFLERMTITAIIGDWGVNALLTDPGHHFHLLQGTRVLLNGEPDKTARPEPTPSSLAVSHQIPSLSEVGFGDLTRVLQNEEVFAELRTALTTLSIACSLEPEPSDYEAYKQAVHRYAEDIVRPAFEKLELWRQREQRKAWGATALAQTIGMGIDALASLRTGGMPTPAGAVAGMVSERTLRRRPEQNEYGISIARDILASVLRY